jgi:peptidoglycan/LPS O-acetylase OafA/YrhL
LLLPGWLDLFGIGMAIAVARVWLDSTHGVLPSPLRRLFALPELCWVLAGALFVLLPPLNDAIRPRSRTAGFLQIQEQRALIALLIIAPLVLGAWTRSPLHGVLRMPWLRWTGTVSYGVYLWHWGILSWLADRGVDSNPVVFVLCGATLSLAAGAASWYVVEQPVLRWARGKERVQPRHTDDGPPVGTNLVRDSTVAPVADAAARSEVAADPG